MSQMQWKEEDNIPGTKSTWVIRRVATKSELLSLSQYMDTLVAGVEIPTDWKPTSSDPFYAMGLTNEISRKRAAGRIDVGIWHVENVPYVDDTNIDWSRYRLLQPFTWGYQTEHPTLVATVLQQTAPGAMIYNASCYREETTLPYGPVNRWAFDPPIWVGNMSWSSGDSYDVDARDADNDVMISRTLHFVSTGNDSFAAKVGSPAVAYNVMAVGRYLADKNVIGDYQFNGALPLEWLQI